MGCFHLLWSLIVGFFVGLIARALVPGGDQMGFILTIVLGIVGSVAGGFIGGLVSKPEKAPGSIPPGSSCRSSARWCCWSSGT